ncbi:MAG: NUDIX domain-containing protein [Nanoarchaeota archaeon]
MQTRVIVCGVVCDNDKVLLGKKANGIPPYPDVWHTLGGGTEDLERSERLLAVKDLDNAYFHAELQRELNEEACVTVHDIRNICPIYRKEPREAIAKNKDGDDIHYVFLEYLCELDDGIAQVRPGDDIVEVRWFDKKDLKTIALTPPSKEMYAELGWL